MQRTTRNSTHGNNAMVQEVKISRIIPDSNEHEKVSSIHTQHVHSTISESHHSEDRKRKNSSHQHDKAGFDLNRILDFVKGDEFIILAVIALLIIEGTGDIILLLALGYLFLADN